MSGFLNDDFVFVIPAKWLSKKWLKKWLNFRLLKPTRRTHWYDTGTDWRR